MDDDRTVSRAECHANVERISTSINGLSDEVGKQNLALFGNDGRGGIQYDITKIITTLNNGDIKTSLSRGDKVLIAVITALSSIIVAVIANGAI